MSTSVLIFHKFGENLCNAGSWAWQTTRVLGSTEVQVEIILSSPTSSSVTDKLFLNVTLTWCKELWKLIIFLSNTHLDNCYFLLLRERSERISDGNLEHFQSPFFYQLLFLFGFDLWNYPCSLNRSQVTTIFLWYFPNSII